METKLNKEFQEINANITEIKSSLEEEIDTIKKENKANLNTLTSAISSLETESQEQFSLLEEEISGIKVQTADFTPIIEIAIKSIVSVITDTTQGSGAIISDKGYIITNFHVIQRAKTIKVLNYDNELINAKLIGYNSGYDIAVLKINQNNLDFLKFGDSDKVKVGQKVIALGNPFGLSFTVTEGIISAVDREGPNNLPIYLQTDVKLNPGNSGGPLVDLNGKIIGINNFRIGISESLGFAIESNIADEISKEIIGSYEQQS